MIALGLLFLAAPCVPSRSACLSSALLAEFDTDACALNGLLECGVADGNRPDNTH
jgi:hypothetical protein